MGREHENTSLKEDMHMANRHLKISFLMLIKDTGTRAVTRTSQASCPGCAVFYLRHACY